MSDSSALVACLVSTALLGCSTTQLQGATDGNADRAIETPAGDDAAVVSTTDADGSYIGSGSFVVTSTLAQDGGAVLLTHTFTMTIAANRTSAILGANGSGSVVAVETPSVGGYRVAQSVSFSVSTGTCGGNVYYQEMTFAFGADGKLSGAGRGSRITFYEDLGSSVPATMTLAGVPDRVAPTFNVALSGVAGDRFGYVNLAASEPLPPPPIPVLSPPVGKSYRFSRPAGPASCRASAGRRRCFGLRRSTTWKSKASPTSLGTLLAPRRSASRLGPRPRSSRKTGSNLRREPHSGGQRCCRGRVLRSSMAPEVCTSLPRTPDLAERSPTTQLALRLAVAPGDTVVRFAYRLVLGGGGSHDGGFIGLGSVGGMRGGAYPPSDNSVPTAATLPGGR